MSSRPQHTLQLNDGPSQESKWRNKKYSRGERQIRSLGKSAVSCEKITNHFPILTTIERLINENNWLKQQLQMRISSEKSDKIVPTSNLLNILYETAISNKDKKVNRFDKEGIVKNLAAYLFVGGGNQLYEFLRDNMKDSIPSIYLSNSTYHRWKQYQRDSFVSQR